MNISTYEARIKALEDQLNPPAPSGNAGDIVAISISPDFGNVNSKLSAMMPLSWEDGEQGEQTFMHDMNITVQADGNTEVNELEITITPGGTGYVLANSQFSEPGQSLTFESSRDSNANPFTGNFMASDSNNMEAVTKLLNVQFTIEPLQ